MEKTPDRVSQLAAVQQEGLELFKRKNADYGDAFANYGPIGVLIRHQNLIHKACLQVNLLVELL